MALKMPPKYFWGLSPARFRNFSGLRFSRWSSVPCWIIKGGMISTGRFCHSAMAWVVRRCNWQELIRSGDDGILHSVSLLKREEDDDAVRVFSAKRPRVSGNDGNRAYERWHRLWSQSWRYSAAGKTGTVKKPFQRLYENSYFAVFAGMALPWSTVDYCRHDWRAFGGSVLGGLVSAPVFSKVMAEPWEYWKLPLIRKKRCPFC